MIRYLGVLLLRWRVRALERDVAYHQANLSHHAERLADARIALRFLRVDLGGVDYPDRVLKSITTRKLSTHSKG